MIRSAGPKIGRLLGHACKYHTLYVLEFFSDDSRTTQFLTLSWLGMFSRLLHVFENFPDPTSVK